VVTFLNLVDIKKRDNDSLLIQNLKDPSMSQRKSDTRWGIENKTTTVSFSLEDTIGVRRENDSERVMWLLFFY
jgi:hypothetical protein